MQGFPGQVQASVTYTLSPENELIVDFAATASSPDPPPDGIITPFSPSQHSYFNLDGPGTGKTVLEHEVFINACALITKAPGWGAMAP